MKLLLLTSLGAAIGYALGAVLFLVLAPVWNPGMALGAWGAAIVFVGPAGAVYGALIGFCKALGAFEKREGGSREQAAREEPIQRHAIYALAAGILMLPLLVAIVVAGVQLVMIAKVSHIHGAGAPRSQLVEVAGAVLFSLAAMILGIVAGLVWSPLGYVVMPLSAGAFTYAAGLVFARRRAPSAPDVAA